MSLIVSLLVIASCAGALSESTGAPVFSGSQDQAEASHQTDAASSDGDAAAASSPGSDSSAVAPSAHFGSQALTIRVNDTDLRLSLADTEAARELAARVQDEPIEVDLDSYGGFEKVGNLPWSLPANDRQMTALAGDVMLYQDNKVVLFYGSNSWAYTPLGRLEGATTDELVSILSKDGARVTIGADS